MATYGERLRTPRAYNLHLINADDCTPDGYPYLAPTNYVPTGLIPFNQARTAKATQRNNTIHYFIDDYQFERIWTKPEAQTHLLQQFPATLTPDFSLYWDMPPAMQHWNVYRSRALGAYWQTLGLTVIPTLQWAWPETWDTTLAGLHSGTVAVSTLGCNTNPETRARWLDGMTHALETIQPSHVICYGQPVPGLDWRDTPHTIYDTYANEMGTRCRNGRQRQQ